MSEEFQSVTQYFLRHRLGRLLVVENFTHFSAMRYSTLWASEQHQKSDFMI